MGLAAVEISTALQQVRWLYVDTAPLVYYVEAHPNYVELMDDIITRIEDKLIEAISSVITLTEVLTYPMRLGQTKYEQAYRDILLHSGGFRLLPVTTETAYLAAHLRARHRLRTPDALHIATAITTGCDAFLTNDRALQRVDAIRVLVLDELEADTA